MIQYLNSQECRAKLDKLFELAHKKFKGDLMYDLDERTRRRCASPHFLCCATYDTEKDEILSYFAWMVSDVRFRDGLLNGTYDENDLYPYDGTAAPILVFDVFIVTHHMHAPFIVRHLTKELHALIQADELDIAGGLSIGGLRFTEHWLKKYGFHEIGKYRGKYPILWANREESMVLNSLVKVYDGGTQRPWTWTRN
jgi:hypothetical protein